jgi:transposase
MVVAIEVGGHSPWVSRLLEELGHEVVVANPREVHLISRSNRKSDRKDAELLARLVRVDRKLLCPIEHREADKSQALMVAKARAAQVRARTLLINFVRQVVKAQGYRLPSCSAEAFAGRARRELPSEIVKELRPTLASIADMTVQIRAYDRRIEALQKRYPETEIFRQIPGVGPVTALVFYMVVQSPERFQDSRMVGAYLGMCPKRDQSGDSDKQLRISKDGDMYARSLLVGCAQYIVGSHGPDCDLRRWGLNLAERGGRNAKKRAVVAVARKLAVLLMALWKSGKPYQPLRNSADRMEAAA